MLAKKLPLSRLAEPVVRVKVEASAKEQCQTLAQNVVDVIIAKGHKA